MNQVYTATGYFPDPTIGKPVSSGYIYVGNKDTDPTIPANQKTMTVLEEDGSLTVVAQPLRTSAGGVPVYNGSPVTILVEIPYSLTVQNSSQAQVYYVPEISSGDVIGTVTGNILATDGTKVFENGTDGSDSWTQATVRAENGTTVVLDPGTLGSNAFLKGADIQADDGTTVLDTGTNGTDSTYIGTILNGSTLADGVVATTQSQADNSTKVATTAYADTASAIQQVVTFQDGAAASSANNIPADNTIPQITEGAQYMTSSITPTAAGSVIVVEVTGQWSAAGAGDLLTMALFNTDVHATNALSAAGASYQTGGGMYTISLRYEALASALNGTSLTTFTIRGGANGSTAYFNSRATATPMWGGVSASWINIYELNPAKVT